MTVTTVVFSPEAEMQLAALFRMIATDRSPAVAARYTQAIVSYCEGLRQFPERGLARNDLRKDLRVTHYRRRVSIAFTVHADILAVIGIFYGGQDLETNLDQ